MAAEKSTVQMNKIVSVHPILPSRKMFLLVVFIYYVCYRILSSVFLFMAQCLNKETSNHTTPAGIPFQRTSLLYTMSCQHTLCLASVCRVLSVNVIFCCRTWKHCWDTFMKLWRNIPMQRYNSFVFLGYVVIQKRTLTCVSQMLVKRISETDFSKYLFCFLSCHCLSLLLQVQCTFGNM